MDENIFKEESFEAILLDSIIKGNNETSTLLPYLRASYFTKSYNRCIANAILNLYSSLSAIPTIGMIKDYIQKNETNESKIEAIEVISDIEENLTKPSLPLNNRYVFGETKNFITRNRMINALKDSMPDITAGNFDSVVSRIREAEVTNALGDIGLQYFDKECHRTERLEVVPSGYAFFNKVLAGGYPKKTLICFAGAQKIGKSMMLVNIAARLALKKTKVVIISFELSEAMQKIRMDSIITGKTMLISGDDDDINARQKVVDQHIDLLTDEKNPDWGIPKDTLFIKEFPAGTASMADVRSYIDLLRIKYDFVPEVVILDYIDHELVQSIEKVKENDPWLKEGRIYTEARALASELNVCCITATQRTKEGGSDFNEDKVETSIGGSVSKSRISDAMFILSQDNYEKQQNEIRVSSWFNRFSPSRTGHYALMGFVPGKARIDEIRSAT